MSNDRIAPIDPASNSSSGEPADSGDPSLLLSRLSDEFLRCPSCRQRYRQPRLLTCLHAVCQACLEALRDAALAGQSRYLRRRLSSFVGVDCPACRRQTDVTPGVDRLPADSVRGRLLEVVSLAEAASAAPAACELCAAGRRPAASRCLDCNKLLCPACRQRHRKVRVTSDHELVDLGRQTAFNCDRHPSELVRFYCTACQTPVCIGCTFSNEHSAHSQSVLKFKDAAELKATELAEFSRLCSAKLRQLASALQLARGLESHVTATEVAIRQAAVDQAASIRSAQQALLDELQAYYASGADLLAGRHEIAAALRDLTQVSSFSELVEARQYSESLLLAPRVASALARYVAFQPPEVPARLRHYRLTFAPAAAPTGLSASLGSLDRQRVCPEVNGSSGSIGSIGSNSCGSSSSSMEVSSLGSNDNEPAAASPAASTAEGSFFTYDNSTLRSSVCRSITTDTLVKTAEAVDAECQTDFCLVVNMGFALFSLHCSQDSEAISAPELIADLDAGNDGGYCPRLAPISCRENIETDQRLCGLFNPDWVTYASGRPSVEARTPLCAGLCTVQDGTVLTCSAAVPTSTPSGASSSVPRARCCANSAQQLQSEVRVCSVMFSSLESNEFDALEFAKPPSLLRDVECQTDSPPACGSAAAGTQTPHRPLRGDLTATGVQTPALALFSRDCQAGPDVADRWCQTGRSRAWEHPTSRLDKATQWESAAAEATVAVGHGSSTAAHQRLYRSGRIVRIFGGVVGATQQTTATTSVCERLTLSPRSRPRRYHHQGQEDEAPCEADASHQQLHRLTQTLASATSPPPVVRLQTATALMATTAGPSAVATSSTGGGSRPAGVKFAKPNKAAGTGAEEPSSLDRLRNFCARLRQKRSGLAKQKIVLVNDQ